MDTTETSKHEPSGILSSAQSIFLEKKEEHLRPINPEGNEAFFGHDSIQWIVSESSPCFASRAIEKTDLQHYLSAHLGVQFSSDLDRDGLHMQLSDMRIVDSKKQNAIFASGADESLCNYQDVDSHAEKVLEELKINLARRELYQIQIAGATLGAGKNKATGLWRRSANCLPKGRFMVRNKIRMRKKKTLTIA